MLTQITFQLAAFFMGAGIAAITDLGFFAIIASKELKKEKENK